MRGLVWLPLCLLLAVSCVKGWRGDGPPESLDGSVWVGTNLARQEVIEMSFLSVVSSTDTESESGTVVFLYSFPSGEVRDTVEYQGDYDYVVSPPPVPGGAVRGNVRMRLTEKEAGETVDASMSFSNGRFYLYFNDSYYPSDPV